MRTHSGQLAERSCERHEHRSAVHHAAGGHHPADHRTRAGRRPGVFPAAGFADAERRLPDHRGHRVAAGRQSRDGRHQRDHAARTPPGHHRRRYRDDLARARSAMRASSCSSNSAATSTVPRATSKRPSRRARVDLPTSLRSNPTYRKINPADAPVMILALTSDTLTGGQIYDSASTIMQQKLLQVDGIGDVTIGGSSLPAVRVELNPRALFQLRHRPRGRARGAVGRQCQQPQGRARAAATAATRSTSTTPPSWRPTTSR